MTILTCEEKLLLAALTERGPQPDHDSIPERALVNLGFARRIDIGLIEIAAAGSEVWLLTFEETGKTPMKNPLPKSITGPIVVERRDRESGEIVYELWDYGSETYHCVCVVREELNDHAKTEADFIALALNNSIGALMVIARSTGDRL